MQYRGPCRTMQVNLSPLGWNFKSSVKKDGWKMVERMLKDGWKKVERSSKEAPKSSKEAWKMVQFLSFLEKEGWKKEIKKEGN